MEIITVNYNTPDLMIRLLKSYFKYGYQMYPIHVLDGSDDLRFASMLEQFCRENKVKYTGFGYNIHHGPGLHYGIMSSAEEQLFLMDSDAEFIMSGLFDELVLGDEFGCGNICLVDKNGFRGGKIKYLHPNCCLISKMKYLESSPFEKRGAPFMTTMNNMKFQLRDSWAIVKKYVNTGSRGTVNRYGYNL